MATKSPKSPGSQFTAKGVVQGTALTSPVDGQPVAVIIDGAGVHRLAVDADLTAESIVVDTRDLSYTTDSVTIGDSNTNAILLVNPDGSINANITTTGFGATPDSELIVGSEDGTTTGTRHVVKVNSDGSLAVSLVQVTYPIVSVFNQITSVAINATTTILTYTVPVAVTDHLLQIDVSGTNIATYDILINSSQYARKRTYFGGNLDATFSFGDSISSAPSFVAGTIITINVTNFRPSLGNFEARIQLIEV
jgi:hypothetical protein